MEKQKHLLKLMRTEYCKKSTKFILSNVGLGGIMIIYTILGAIVFMKLETTNELEGCMALMGKYFPLENKTASDLWNIGRSYPSNDDKESAEAAINQIVTDFRDQILTLEYDGTNCTMLGETDGPEYRWSFSGSLLFAVTVFTTVGYGNIAPETFWGRLVCIVYALIGSPLMLVFLANIGEIMADVFRFVYSKVCCCGCMRRDETPTELSASTINLLESLEKNDLRLQEVVIVEEESDQLSVPLVITLGVIAFYIFMGALLFGTWEQWSLLQAAYYCFITISTIGFGDVVPGTSTMETSGQITMLSAALYMIFGMAIMSMAFNLIQEEMLTKFIWISDKLGLSKKDDNDEETDEYKDDDVRG